MLRQRWEAIRQELLGDTYRPSPVLKVEIPKPGGKGVRMLGIPTVLDRLIQQALIKKAQNGVRVYLIYDAIGSQKITRRFVQDLRRSSIQVKAFASSQGFRNRFQINFRNHRKILIIDGHIALYIFLK